MTDLVLRQTGIMLGLASMMRTVGWPWFAARRHTGSVQAFNCAIEQIQWVNDSVPYSQVCKRLRIFVNEHAVKRLSWHARTCVNHTERLHAQFCIMSSTRHVWWVGLVSADLRALTKPAQGTCPALARQTSLCTLTTYALDSKAEGSVLRHALSMIKLFPPPCCPSLDLCNFKACNTQCAPQKLAPIQVKAFGIVVNYRLRSTWSSEAWSEQCGSCSLGSADRPWTEKP